MLENFSSMVKRHILGFTILLLVIFGCKEETKRDLDFETLRPKSQSQSSATDAILDTTQAFLGRLMVDSIQLNYEGFYWDSVPHFLDRFSFTKNKKNPDGIDKNADRWIFRKANNATTLGQWYFKDSLAKKSAFYNWLDHFGKEQKSISLYGRAKLSSEYLLLLINQKSILSISSPTPIENKKWEAYQRQMHPRDSIMLKIIQPKGKKCDWYKKSGTFTFVKISI